MSFLVNLNIWDQNQYQGTGLFIATHNRSVTFFVIIVKRVFRSKKVFYIKRYGIIEKEQKDG